MAAAPGGAVLPNPMSTHCPNCQGDLAGRCVPHCEARPKPCGWVKHKPCGYVVDPRRHRAIPGGTRP